MIEDDRIEALLNNLRNDQVFVYSSQIHEYPKMGLDDFDSLVIEPEAKSEIILPKIDSEKFKGIVLSGFGSGTAKAAQAFPILAYLKSCIRNGTQRLGFDWGRHASVSLRALIHALPRLSASMLAVAGNTKLLVKDFVALCHALPISKVETLRLPNWNLNKALLSRLAEVLPDTKITYLDLSYNPLSFGLATLLKSSKKLTVLKLDDCKLNDEAMYALANGLPGTQISRLSLVEEYSSEHTKLSDEAFIAFLEALIKTNTVALDLRERKLNRDQFEALIRILPKTKITSLQVTIHPGTEHLLAKLVTDAPALRQLMLYPRYMFNTYIKKQSFLEFAKALPGSNLRVLGTGDLGNGPMLVDLCKAISESKIRELHTDTDVSQYRLSLLNKLDALTYRGNSREQHTSPSCLPADLVRLEVARPVKFHPNIRQAQDVPKGLLWLKLRSDNFAKKVVRSRRVAAKKALAMAMADLPAEEKPTMTAQFDEQIQKLEELGVPKETPIVHAICQRFALS